MLYPGVKLGVLTCFPDLLQAKRIRQLRVKARVSLNMFIGFYLIGGIK
jgi:hypothetical protein